MLSKVGEQVGHDNINPGLKLVYGILMDLNKLYEYQIQPKEFEIPTALGGASVRAILSDHPGALTRYLSPLAARGYLHYRNSFSGDAGREKWPSISKWSAKFRTPVLSRLSRSFRILRNSSRCCKFRPLRTVPNGTVFFVRKSALAGRVAFCVQKEARKPRLFFHQFTCRSDSHGRLCSRSSPRTAPFGPSGTNSEPPKRHRPQELSQQSSFPF